VSKTTIFLKRQASNVRFYSPVVSKGTLLVAGAALGVILKQLMDWKVQESQHIPFSEFDVRIMWVAVAYASILQWIGYVDKTAAKHSDEKKKRDETDAFARSQTDPGKLKTLG
jgi:hypothetical protein